MADIRISKATHSYYVINYSEIEDMHFEEKKINK